MEHLVNDVDLVDEASEVAVQNYMLDVETEKHAIPRDGACAVVIEEVRRVCRASYLTP